jgi:hypothetical protein
MSVGSGAASSKCLMSPFTAERKGEQIQCFMFFYQHLVGIIYFWRMIYFLIEIAIVERKKERRF